MINLKTKVNPYQFEKELGILHNIYTTTISKSTYFVLIWSLLILIVGITKSIQLINNINGEFFIWLMVMLLMIFNLIYFPLAIRFCYVATFQKGIVIKRRFKTIVLMYEEIKNIELVNLSMFYNSFRSDNSKELAIDIFLSNDNVISIGESHWISKFIAFPRIPYSTKI